MRGVPALTVWARSGDWISKYSTFWDLLGITRSLTFLSGRLSCSWSDPQLVRGLMLSRSPQLHQLGYYLSTFLDFLSCALLSLRPCFSTVPYQKPSNCRFLHFIVLWKDHVTQRHRPAFQKLMSCYHLFPASFKSTAFSLMLTRPELNSFPSDSI